MLRLIQFLKSSKTREMFHLADVSVRHVVDPEALVADALLGVLLGVDVDVALGRVEDVRHVDAQQVGNVLDGLPGA